MKSLKVIFALFLITVIVAAGTIIWSVAQDAAADAATLKRNAQPFTTTKPESVAETIARFRVEADGLAREYLTNAVVGFRRIRHVYADTSSDVVTNWKGWAESEYINQLGGVGLVTTHFQYSTGYTGKILYCDEDLEKRLDDLRGAFWIGLGITNRPPGGWPDVTQ